MSGATLVHLAFFGAGAVAGAVITSTVAKRTHVPAAIPDTPRVIVPAATTSVTPSIQNKDVLKFGSPGPIFDLIQRRAYIVGYDRKLRHPAWTAERLTAASLGRGPSKPDEIEKGDRGRSTFTEDDSVPIMFRARLADYFRSGYDRGHMVPAADAKASQAAMDETFLLTNIAPQVGNGFNRHYWAYVEDWCRRLTGSFSEVFVFTVPLYLPKKHPDGKWRVTYEMIGDTANVGVPTHFGKVVLAVKPSSPSTPRIAEMSLGAFVLPNAEIPDETPLESFMIPVDAVERASGLMLFPDNVKSTAKNICGTTSCQLLIRRFDDAQKQIKAHPIPNASK